MCSLTFSDNDNVNYLTGQKCTLQLSHYELNTYVTPP